MASEAIDTSYFSSQIDWNVVSFPIRSHINHSRSLFQSVESALHTIQLLFHPLWFPHFRLLNRLIINVLKPIRSPRNQRKLLCKSVIHLLRLAFIQAHWFLNLINWTLHSLGALCNPLNKSVHNQTSNGAVWKNVVANNETLQYG